MIVLPITPFPQLLSAEENRLKRRGREKRTLLLIKARRRTALGRTPRKRKSFRCFQIPSLQAPIRYTKTKGTVRKSSREKPKRTCLTSMEGARGAAIYSKDCIQAKLLCARGQKKNRCSKDSRGKPQKQSGDTPYPKPRRRSAV